MGDATSSSENDASSGEGPNAKRCRRDPDAPKPDKGVVVLLDSDVSVSLNGQVPLPNTIEMAKLKKPEKGQYCRINFTSEMTEIEVLSTLHSKFSIIKNKRLRCASATEGRLDFHGDKQIWNGAEIKKFAKGHSALYLFAEDNHEYEDSQVLTGVAQESLIKPVSMTSCSKQRELIAQTSEQGSSLQQAPVVAAAAAAHTNVPAKVFFSQTTSAKKLPVSERKRKSHSHGHQESPVLMAVAEGETTESGIDSPLENESNDTVQSRVLAATQRLKVLAQLRASSNQRHLTGTMNTFGAFVSNANHEMLQSAREDLTTQPDYTIGSKQGLSVVQKRPNDPIVQTTVDPVAQESLNSVSMTSHNKQSKLIAQTSEQGSCLQHTPDPAAAATTHKNVKERSERKSHPPGHQEFPVLMAVSEGETTESGIDSLLENESNDDTVQSRDIGHVISPCKGSTKGGDKFHILLKGVVPLEIDSFVAYFENCGRVYLEQDINFCTLTGSTPESLKGPCTVKVTVKSLDGSWCGGESEFEYIDDPLTTEECLSNAVKSEHLRRKLFDIMHKEMSSNKPSDEQASSSSGKTGPGSSSLSKSTCAWSVKLLQLLVYKAAEIDGQEFIQMIFSTSAGKVVFDSYRNNATLPGDVARVNGHSALADYLQDVNNSLSKESNSDTGTEDIDWLELKHAVDKEQSLTSGTDDAQISKKCQPPGYPESDDDENDYFADDEMSPCSSPSYTNLRDSENEDHSQNTNMIESSYEKEVNGENLSVENHDSSEFPLHLVGNQLEVIPSMKAERAGYKHKQLDSDDVESYSSGDDITEKEYDSAVPCRDEVENWETIESEVMSAIKETSARPTSSRNATRESGLDGDQKELRMTNNDETSGSRVIEFLRKKEEYEEVNIPTENKDLSVFYPHLKVIPPIQGVNDGYEHKQLDYEEVESHRSEDDMHENENVYRVFKTDQNELNKITIPSGKRTTQLYPALPSISSYRETDDVVVTDVSEWGLDGHQKELRMTVNDETTRGRGSHEETPCDAAVMRNLESPFSSTRETETGFFSSSWSHLYLDTTIEYVFPRIILELLAETESAQAVRICELRERVGNQLEDIPSMKAKSSGYEYKQLDSDDVESYSSEDDITEKEYESTVPCRDEVENWETVESEVMSAMKETSARTTGSHNATHESGLDGDQKELRMTDNAETSGSRDSSVFYSHLKVIPPTQDVHKQLDYEEVESHRSEDDMPENEYIYSGFKTDQNELNKITVPSGKRTTNSHASALLSISGLWDADNVVATNGSEWGLDGDQRELRIIDNDETTRSRGSHEETPCAVAVMRNLESPFSSTRETETGFFSSSWSHLYLDTTIVFTEALRIILLGVRESATAGTIFQVRERARRIWELQERDFRYATVTEKLSGKQKRQSYRNKEWTAARRILELRERVRRILELQERAHDFDRLFPRDPAFEWAVSKLHQALNEAKLNFQTAVSFWHPMSCHFLSAANPKTALHAEELGRARAYLDEITKKERSSTCLYISCYGQDVFLSILKTRGAISLRKVKVGNNFLHDKLATNLDTVFAIMANSVLSEEDCNKQSVHDIEPKLDSSQILSSCYKLLIDPVSGLLEKPSIIIVPKGSLCLVPFAALLNDESGMYLSDTFRIRVVPSLTTLKLIQDSPADYHSQTGALVVGDPTVGEVIYRGSVCSKFVPLPGARKEAEMVGRLLGVQPLLGQNATKQAILQMLHSVSLIHIAAHGSADRGEIALAPPVKTSGILQEEDYLLKLSDVSTVQLRAKLVVLSCCHSGRGQVRSEGIIGMAQAFLGSGARSVLVALGALNDRATEQLMCHFYEHLVRGESASESLHQAMKWMRGNGFTKVSDWAPFTLIGDDVTFDFRE